MALLHAGVATLALLCLLGLARAQGSQESEEKFAFLNPQSGCNIRCENGGVCAFSINNPRRHKCICFVGMYYGTRCQHKHEVPETPTSPVLPVDPTTTVATTTEMSNEELEDYTADWKDFNNGLLEKEDSEEQWEQAASMENEADLEPGDLEALPEEYRDGQPEDADDYKDYYLHPKKASTGYASAVDEVTIPTTTTQKWSVSKEFAESHEYVNDDGSQEDGWMMVRRPAKSASSPLLSALSLAVLLLLN